MPFWGRNRLNGLVFNTFKSSRESGPMVLAG